MSKRFGMVFAKALWRQDEKEWFDDSNFQLTPTRIHVG
jgi:hypothetical protein